MKTLIELFEERGVENVIAPETFRPERIVYLCPEEIAGNRRLQNCLKEHFADRGLKAGLDFIPCSLYQSDLILQQLNRVVVSRPDCVMDVTGGTDAALFAAGMLRGQLGIPAFTYSRRQNRFYDIGGASFADGVECTLQYTAAEFFRIAGGEMRRGRVDNAVLSGCMKYFDPFFQIFLRNRRNWNDAVTFFQRISQQPEGEKIRLSVSGNRMQKAERGGRVTADTGLLQELTDLGFLKDTDLHDDESISFRFRDELVRSWLRDMGSVLELYMYKVCRDAGIFRDVVCSAVVNWDDGTDGDPVSNEIDVVATRGTVPLFISCKTCAVRTEAINELAVLRDRFGGKGAKAVIVTSESCGSAARHRAAQMGIAVIDREELKQGLAGARLRVIMKLDDDIRK